MKQGPVRCIDCGNARKMETADGIAIRCLRLGVGKVKNAKRICDMFIPREGTSTKNR